MLRKFFAMPGGRVVTIVVFPFIVWAMYQDLSPQTMEDHFFFGIATIAGGLFFWVMNTKVIDPFRTMTDRLLDKATEESKKKWSRP